MGRYLELFIRGNNEGGNARRLRTDSGYRPAIGPVIQRQAKPGAAAGDFGACGRVVLANPASENDCVNSTQRRRK